MQGFIALMQLLFFVLLLDLPLIHKDATALKNFKEQHPDKGEIRSYLKSALLRNTAFFLALIFIPALLSLICATCYWKGVDTSLLKILKPNLNLRTLFFDFFFTYIMFPVSLVFLLIVKIRKIKIALSIVFPIIFLSGFFCLGLLWGTTGLRYYKNPLADTKVSQTFNPRNLPLLKEGMTENEVLELLGDPISRNENCFTYAEENGRGVYEYLILDVYFENGIVERIYKKWEYED